MSPAREEAEGDWEKRWRAKVRAFIRSERLLLINRLLKTKKNETNEGEYAPIWWCHCSQHEGTKVPDWSQKFENFVVDEVFFDSDETDEESEENDNDIDYDQVPSLEI